MPHKCYKREYDGVVSCTEFGCLSLLVIVIAIVPLIVSVTGGLHQQLSDLLRIWCRQHSQWVSKCWRVGDQSPYSWKIISGNAFTFAWHNIQCGALHLLAFLLACAVFWCACGVHLIYCAEFHCKDSLLSWKAINVVVFRSLLRSGRTNEVRETAGSAISNSRL